LFKNGILKEQSTSAEGPGALRRSFILQLDKTDGSTPYGEGVGRQAEGWDVFGSPVWGGAGRNASTKERNGSRTLLSRITQIQPKTMIKIPFLKSK
jgi:hypothetical protein